MKTPFTLASEDRGCELAEGATVDRVAMLKAYRAGENPGVNFRATVFGEGPNKNHVILNPDELESFAESFKGQPFLQDHSRKQGDRGGTILESKMERVGDRRVIRQRIAAVKPFAVEGVLDGTIDRFSIGWSAKEYICTACDRSFFDEDEPHTPWDLGTKDKKTGKTIEVLMKGLSGAETSAVTHPAVDGTSTDGLLSQLQQLFERKPASGNHAGGSTVKGEGMLAKILSLLGLSADTAEPEALKALESRLSAPKRPAAGLLSALGLGAEATDDEAIAAVHKFKATHIAREDFDRVSKELGEERADRLVRKYEDERKITPAMKDWARGLAASNPTEFERVMKDFPVQGPALAVAPPNTKTPASTTENGLTELEEEHRVSAGLSVEEWKKTKAKLEARADRRELAN